jgi:hypothetical protein
MANLLCQKMLTSTIQNHLKVIHEKEEEILDLTELAVRMEEEEVVITEKQTTGPLREGDKIKKAVITNHGFFISINPFH